MEKQNKARIEWVDIAKGIGILLVLAGHAPRDIMRDRYPLIDFGYYFIYTFHMSLFFFLSGWMFSRCQAEKKTSVQFLSGKINTLLIPWVVFSALIYLLIYGVNAVSFIKDMLYGTFLEQMGVAEYAKLCLSGMNPYCIHLWYMYTLFFVQIIIFMLCRIYRKATKHPEISRRFQWLLMGAAVVLFIGMPDELPILANIGSYTMYFAWGMTGPQDFGNRRFLTGLIPGTLICAVNVLAVNMNGVGSAAFRGSAFDDCGVMCTGEISGGEKQTSSMAGKKFFWNISPSSAVCLRSSGNSPCKASSAEYSFLPGNHGGVYGIQCCFSLCSSEDCRADEA